MSCTTRRAMRSTCSSVSSAPFTPEGAALEADFDGDQDTSSGSGICGSGTAGDGLDDGGAFGGSLDVAGHDGAGGGGAAGASHGDDDEAVEDAEDFARSSNVIFGNAFVSPLYAGGSSHGEDDVLGGGGVAAIFFMSSRFIFGNARVSLLNCSAGGDAPNGESSLTELGFGSSQGDAAGGEGVAGAGCAGICCVEEPAFGRLSKLIFGSARVSPLNCSAGGEAPNGSFDANGISVVGLCAGGADPKMSLSWVNAPPAGGGLLKNDDGGGGGAAAGAGAGAAGGGGGGGGAAFSCGGALMAECGAVGAFAFDCSISSSTL